MVKRKQNLMIYATTCGHNTEVAPWDIAWLSEKKMQAHYAISQEELRPFFPIYKVMEGLFNIIHTLYGMTLEEMKGVDTWHPDVTCYRVMDSDNNLRGYVYVDLFARPHKRGGAWMNSFQSRRISADGEVQLPIATVTCNFAKAMGTKPAIL